MFLRRMYLRCICPGTLDCLTILSVFLASSQQLCISWSLLSGDNHDLWVCITFTMLVKNRWKCCNWFLLFSSNTDQLSQFLCADGVCIWSAGWGEQVLWCPPQISRLSGDIDFVWGMVWWGDSDGVTKFSDQGLDKPCNLKKKLHHQC